MSVNISVIQPTPGKPIVSTTINVTICNDTIDDSGTTATLISRSLINGLKILPCSIMLATLTNKLFIHECVAELDITLGTNTTKLYNVPIVDKPAYGLFLGSDWRKLNGLVSVSIADYRAYVDVHTGEIVYQHGNKPDQLKLSTLISESKLGQIFEKAAAVPTKPPLSNEPTVSTAKQKLDNNFCIQEVQSLFVDTFEVFQLSQPNRHYDEIRPPDQSICLVTFQASTDAQTTTTTAAVTSQVTEDQGTTAEEDQGTTAAINNG